MTDQNQSTGKNSVAIQSNRDTYVHTGMGPDEMRQIFEILLDQQKHYAQIANATVDDRMKNLEERLIYKFATMNNANPEAFKDPDFQYALISAQKTYARCGDEKVADIIVDVIAERSKVSERNRLQMTLNEAVNISGSLTVNEFAELSLAFLLKNTHNNKVGSIAQFVEYMNKHIPPFLGDITKSDSSYEYLESQRCAIIEHSEVTIPMWLPFRYGGIFSKGFTEEQLKAPLPHDKKDILDGAKRSDGQNLVIPCLNDPQKLQFCTQNRETLIKELQNFDIDEPVINSLASVYAASYMPFPEIKEMLEPIIPDFIDFVEIWDNSPIKKLKLTSIGIAIAHSNLRHMIDFEADLSIWIN